jgi:hypothetical protein
VPFVPFEILAGSCPVVSFRVVPTGAPEVVRHCPRCGGGQPFRSSDRFRVNAQKQRLDVWLVRWCGGCGATWNQPVHDRVTPTALGPLLAAYHHDDPDRVHAVAYDEAALRRHGRVVPATFRVETDGAPIPPFVARFVLERPFVARLDRVLAEALGWSRRSVLRAAADGRILVDEALDGDVSDGTRAWVGGARRAEEAA